MPPRGRTTRLAQERFGQPPDSGGIAAPGNARRLRGRGVSGVLAHGLLCSPADRGLAAAQRVGSVRALRGRRSWFCEHPSLRGRPGVTTVRMLEAIMDGYDSACERDFGERSRMNTGWPSRCVARILGCRVSFPTDIPIRGCCGCQFPVRFRPVVGEPRSRKAAPRNPESSTVRISSVPSQARALT